VIYLDASVILARIFAESAVPNEEFWHQPLTSSRLLQYEVWNRIYARGLADFRSQEAEALLDHVRLVELSNEVLGRALQPFPVQPRTLDALHLATMDFLYRRGATITLASYDRRLLAAAATIGIEAAPL
jgi:predicted nucleic acid-binding protein